MEQANGPPPSRSETERRAANGGRPIVAFDFDGTLTVRDSFTAFLRWRVGPIRYALGMAKLGFAALRYLIDRGQTIASANGK